MIYIECKKKIKCSGCKGTGYNLIEGYEYICNDCKGIKYKIKSVLMDIETLAEKVEEKIKWK
tara:strand:- start:21344 stop:21529 length:186 start_codon:yes stop_codon:yes gene_type:complete